MPFYKVNVDVRNNDAYRGECLLEHAMKIAERGLKRKFCKFADVDTVQFGFTPGGRTTNALFIARKVPEEYTNKDGKLYMCFLWILRRHLIRVLRKMIEWPLGKKCVCTWSYCKEL